MKRSTILSALLSLGLAATLAVTATGARPAAAAVAAGTVTIDTNGVDRYGSVDVEVTVAPGPVAATIVMLRGESTPVKASVTPDTDETRVALAFVGNAPKGGVSFLGTHVDNVIRVRLHVTVPANVGLQTRQRNGSLDVRDVGGPLDLQTQNGPIAVRRVAKRIQARTDNGSITVAESQANIDVRSANGSISITGATADVAAQTDNGNIDVARPGGSVRAKTDKGNVSVTLGSSRAPNATLETSMGNVSLAVPQGFSTPVDAHTDLGHVSDLGTPGNGPGSVRLRTSLGSISITRE